MQKEIGKIKMNKLNYNNGQERLKIGQKRYNSLAIGDEITTTKLRKLNIHQYEEIVSKAKLVSNSEISGKKYRENNNNIDSQSLFNSHSPINQNTRNLNISNISNVAEINSTHNSDDSTFCELIDEFSELDLKTKDKIMNELCYMENHHLKNKNQYKVISEPPQMQELNIAQKNNYSLGIKGDKYLSNNDVEVNLENKSANLNSYYLNKNPIEVKMTKIIKSHPRVNYYFDNKEKTLVRQQAKQRRDFNSINDEFYKKAENIQNQSPLYVSNKNSSFEDIKNLPNNFKKENISNIISYRNTSNTSSYTEKSLLSEDFFKNPKQKFSYLSLKTETRANFKESFSDLISKKNLNNRNFIYKNNNYNLNTNKINFNINQQNALHFGNPPMIKKTEKSLQESIMHRPYSNNDENNNNANENVNNNVKNNFKIPYSNNLRKDINNKNISNVDNNPSKINYPADVVYKKPFNNLKVTNYMNRNQVNNVKKFCYYVYLIFLHSDIYIINILAGEKNKFKQ